jgi:hypothetical protein
VRADTSAVAGLHDLVELNSHRRCAQICRLDVLEDESPRRSPMRRAGRFGAGIQVAESVSGKPQITDESFEVRFFPALCRSVGAGSLAEA